MSLSFKARTPNPRALLAIKVCAVVSGVVVFASFFMIRLLGMDEWVYQLKAVLFFVLALPLALVALGLCWWQLRQVRLLHHRRGLWWQLFAGVSALHLLLVVGYGAVAIFGPDPHYSWLTKVVSDSVRFPFFWLTWNWLVLLWGLLLLRSPHSVPQLALADLELPLPRLLAGFRIVGWCAGLVLCTMVFVVWFISDEMNFVMDYVGSTGYFTYDLLLAVFFLTPCALGLLWHSVVAARRHLSFRGALDSTSGRRWCLLARISVTLTIVAMGLWAVGFLIMMFPNTPPVVSFLVHTLNRLLTFGFPVVLGCVVWAYRMLADYQRRW